MGAWSAHRRPAGVVATASSPAATRSPLSGLRFDVADGFLDYPADGPGSPPRNSIATVVSDTSAVTLRWANWWPKATFCPATMITPAFDARRRAVTGSVVDDSSLMLRGDRVGTQLACRALSCRGSAR